MVRSPHERVHVSVFGGGKKQNKSGHAGWQVELERGAARKHMHVYDRDAGTRRHIRQSSCGTMVVELVEPCVRARDVRMGQE